MTAPDPAGLAERLLLLVALRKRVVELEGVTREELSRAVPPGTTMRPEVNGSQAGTVSRTTARITAQITDPEAFAGWLAREYPTEVELVVRPRKAAEKRILDMATAAGVPSGPGGEVGPDAPAGLVVREGPGYVSARPDMARMGELWARIRDALPELGAASEVIE